MGRKLKMKFYVKDSGRRQFFSGQIMKYDGLTGVYFPCDREVVYIDPDDKDMSHVIPSHEYLMVFSLFTYFSPRPSSRAWIRHSIAAKAQDMNLHR